MRHRTRTIAFPTGAVRGGTAVLAMASAAAWIAAMAPRLLAQAEFGPICSGHEAWALHCPACYAAAALAALAMLALALEGRLTSPL